MTQGRLEDSFWTRQFPRWAGAAAMLGGLLCALAAFLHSLEPTGCIGMDCDLRSLRSATGIVPLSGSAAAILILVGIAGLTLIARQSGRFTKLANTGLASAAAGFILLLAGALIQTVFFSGNFPGMPFFVIPGLLAVIIGFVIIGIFILRSGVLPRWLGVFLVLSSVALLAANEQTAAVLLAIPFGLAMTTTGFLMWTGGTSYITAPARR